MSIDESVHRVKEDDISYSGAKEDETFSSIKMLLTFIFNLHPHYEISKEYSEALVGCLVKSLSLLR